MQTHIITHSIRVAGSFSPEPRYFRNSPKIKSLHRRNSLITVNTSQLELKLGRFCLSSETEGDNISLHSTRFQRRLMIYRFVKVVQYQLSDHRSLSVQSLRAQSHEFYPPQLTINRKTNSYLARHTY